MKNFSFSLFFAICCLFSSINAFVPNCRTLNGDNSTCFECNSGYSLVSGNCSCMIPNCEWCTVDNSNSTVCGQCSDYFGPKNTDNSTCYSCYLDGCFNCSLDANSLPICNNCSEGYYLKNNKCVLCSDVISGCKACNLTNGNLQCVRCNIEYQTAYYSNGTNCVDCGSDTLSKGCQGCGNYEEYENKNYTGYCRQCQEGYAFTNITNFCSSLCNISNCKVCSRYSTYCNECNDGYGWDSVTQSCIFCNNSNCSACNKAGYCYNCLQGYFTNGTGQCVSCLDYGTAPANCETPYCTNNSNVMYSSCLSCNVGYILSEETSPYSCLKCSNLISNCSTCEYSYNENDHQSHPSCSKCDSGFYLQYLTDNLTYACAKNCSSKHIFNDTLKMCVPCSELFGSNCSSCNTTQCLTCDSSYYVFVTPETNSTCSKCTNQGETIVNVSNVQLCSRKANAYIQNFTTVNNSKSALVNATCGIASSKAFFAYGPATSIQTITLEMVQAKVGTVKNTNIPSTSDTNWIGYGVRKQNGTQPADITLIPPLKLAGELYRLTIWCQSALNISDISSVYKEWIQPNNGGIKTKISFTTSVKLSSAQKKSLGIAIRKTLKINRDIYTDDGELVPLKMQTMTGSRVLNDIRNLADNTTNTVTFVIVPDYTSDSDMTSALINQTLANSSSNFVQNVTNYWNSLNSSNSVQLSNVTTVAVTSSIPSPILSGVTLSQNDNSLTVSFTLTNTDGTFYLGLDNATYGLQNANLSSAGITYPSWSQFVQGLNASSVALVKFSNLSVTANKSSSLTLQGMDSNKTYMVYYGASNNDLPPAYTVVFANVTNTIPGGGTGSDSFRILAWSCSVIALILIL